MFHRHGFAVCLTTGMMAICLVAAQQLQAQSVDSLNPDRTSAQPFSQQWLQDRARQLAAQPFQPQRLAADNPLLALDYDTYRRIVFNPEAAVWRDAQGPFQLQLFHPGFLHAIPVGLHTVNEGQSQRLPFSPAVFDYPHSLAGVDPADAGGYAGFRIHYPINSSARHEEFLVFLGSSYFRAVGKDQFYGLSARGLAVNTVGPGGEEFPHFADFWIERPANEAQQIVLHALLDSPSVTGAFHFSVKPGAGTRMEVDATLYPRRDLPRVGIAPLTSMFLFDTTNRDRFDDFRNAVHDSDGLQILQTNGETVWRPLSNPSQVQVSAFGAAMPAGFGLLQRHQDFAEFNDAEARYDKRTSLWIEPLDDWGAGHVELVEIPSVEEINDNIVAYWQPAAGLQAGSEYRFRYRMLWGKGSPAGPAQGRIVDTAAGAVAGSGERVFVIDYSDGSQLPVAEKDGAVRIIATSSAGTITNVSGTLVDATDRYRAYIKLDPAGAELAELRVTLEVGGRQWGETWLYRWTR